ncbi:MAG TPA: hypothetical protein VHZ24_15715 [Pirellulales bacterium]|jgi:hypothetical protein|nr:hypothetical protein [Pirellulales bacterium]
MVRHLVVAIALGLGLLMAGSDAANAAQRRYYSYSPNRAGSNYPGWQNSYPRGSVRKYGYLPFYMRADRRPLNLTP